MTFPPSEFLPPSTFIAQCFTPDQWSGDRGREWSRGSFIMASYNNFYTPNSKYPDCTDAGRNAAVTAPRSFHPGGVNALFCDGHVQFIKDSIGDLDLAGGLDAGRRRGHLCRRVLNPRRGREGSPRSPYLSGSFQEFLR